MNPGFPLRIIGTENHLKIENEQGSLTLSKEGEEHRLVLEDAEGRVVFEGSFQPEGGLKSLPEKARRQLETMKLDQLEFPRSAEPEGDESQGTPEAPTPPPHRPGEDDEGIL